MDERQALNELFKANSERIDKLERQYPRKNALQLYDDVPEYAVAYNTGYILFGLIYRVGKFYNRAGYLTDNR